MKKSLSIRLKGLFLLLVFSLNTVVGFACSVGLDMGFNSMHHREETKVHLHANGEKFHNEKLGYKHSHKGDKNNCCNHEVTKIAQADKALPQANTVVSLPFFTAFVATYCINYIFYLSQVTPALKYFELGYDPPGSEIRIFIQSFQI